MRRLLWFELRQTDGSPRLARFQRLRGGQQIADEVDFYRMQDVVPQPNQHHKLIVSNQNSKHEILQRQKLQSLTQSVFMDYFYSPTKLNCEIIISTQDHVAHLYSASSGRTTQRWSMLWRNLYSGL